MSDELAAARALVAAKKTERDQMRSDWGYYREPEEVLNEALTTAEAERDRLRAKLNRQVECTEEAWKVCDEFGAVIEEAIAVLDAEELDYDEVCRVLGAMRDVLDEPRGATDGQL